VGNVFLALFVPQIIARSIPHTHTHTHTHTHNIKKPSSSSSSLTSNSIDQSSRRRI
jgi:hypothetical protein